MGDGKPRECKVLFHLEQDEDGYPPFAVESVWAESTGDGEYAIGSIPFFARQATLGDTVQAVDEDGELFYASTVTRSGHSLLRVVFFDAREVSRLRSRLMELSCSSELFVQGDLRLIAVDLPPDTLIAEVRAVLDPGCEANLWDYEEAILRHRGR